MAQKFYSVTKGRVPGVFDNYSKVKSSIDGFSGAAHKGFKNLDEAIKNFTTQTGKTPTLFCKNEQEFKNKTVKINTKNQRTDRQHILVYTDGSCLKNPGGPGGLAYCIRENGTITKKYSRGYVTTTNNRMELKAIWAALHFIDTEINKDGKFNKEILIKTDSQYCQNALIKWLPKWKLNGFKTKNGNVKNRDIIEPIENYIKKYRVKFEWVKGHANIPDNELVDQLASQAAKNNAIHIDKGYV